MKPYPLKISVRVVERQILESLLLLNTPGLSSEHLEYAGKVDQVERIRKVGSMPASYILKTTPGLWPRQVLRPIGRTLSVSTARPREEREIPGRLDSLLESARSRSVPSSRLYVGGLPYEMSDTALLKLFIRFGEVQAISIVTDRFHNHRSKGFGFVEMSTEEVASQAVQSLHGKEVLESGEFVSDYNSLSDEAPNDQESVMSIIETAMKTFAKLVCNEPGKLQDLEWRDVERLLAVVFEGIGYSVHLTPPARDGRKDIVVQFIASGKRQSYYVEVKHWVSGKKVGQKIAREFLSVVVRDEQQGGILISTSGFSGGIMQGFTEIERKKLRLGDDNTVVSLCRTYLNVTSGLIYPVNFTDTLIAVTREGAEDI